MPGLKPAFAGRLSRNKRCAIACIFVQGLLHALLAFPCRWSVFEKEKNPQFGGDFPLVFAKNSQASQSQVKNSERQNAAKDAEIAF